MRQPAPAGFAGKLYESGAAGPASPAPDLLALHAELTRIIDRAPRSSSIEAKARAVRALVARLALEEPAALISRTDPVAGVRRAAELALDAGADWAAIVAAIETAATLRPRG